MLLLAFAEFDLPSKSNHSERVCVWIVCACNRIREARESRRKRKIHRAQSADSASSRDGKKERIKERTNERTDGKKKQREFSHLDFDAFPSASRSLNLLFYSIVPLFRSLVDCLSVFSSFRLFQPIRLYPHKKRQPTKKVGWEKKTSQKQTKKKQTKKKLEE